MSNEELVRYRFSRANETYDEAILLASKNHWNAVANRLYYAITETISARIKSFL